MCELFPTLSIYKSTQGRICLGLGRREHFLNFLALSTRPCELLILGQTTTSTSARGGRGHCLFEGTHCQTIFLASQRCLAHSLFLTPPIFEGHRPLPPPPKKKKKHSRYKVINKSDSNYCTCTQLSVQ